MSDLYADKPKEKRPIKYISKRIGCTWCKKEMTFSQWEKHMISNAHIDNAFANAYIKNKEKLGIHASRR